MRVLLVAGARPDFVKAAPILRVLGRRLGVEAGGYAVATVHRPAKGTNRLAPWPLTVDGILGCALEAMGGDRHGARTPEGWEGRAAERIVEALEGAPCREPGVAPAPHGAEPLPDPLGTG